MYRRTHFESERDDSDRVPAMEGLLIIPAVGGIRRPQAVWLLGDLLRKRPARRGGAHYVDHDRLRLIRIL